MGDHIETTIPLGSGLQNAIALDYDYNQNCIYWADISLDTIKRSFLNGSGMLNNQCAFFVCGTLVVEQLLIFDDTYCAWIVLVEIIFFSTCDYHQLLPVYAMPHREKKSTLVEGYFKLVLAFSAMHVLPCKL